MVSKQAELVLHQPKQGLPEQHTSMMDGNVAYLNFVFFPQMCTVAQ